MVAVTYLFEFATNGASSPLATTEVNELLPKLFIGILGDIVIHAWQLFSEDALLSAMASECTSPRLVLGSILFGAAHGSQHQARGADEPAGDSMTHRGGCDGGAGGRRVNGIACHSGVTERDGMGRNWVNKECEAAMAASNDGKQMVLQWVFMSCTRVDGYGRRAASGSSTSGSERPRQPLIPAALTYLPT